MDALDATGKEADRSTHVDDLISLESVARLHPEPAPSRRGSGRPLGRPQPDGPCVTSRRSTGSRASEWDDVSSSVPPRAASPPASQDEEGERRVFHVAITRARRRLVVLGDVDAPSIFVGELDGSRPHPPARRRPATRRRPVVGPGGTAHRDLPVTGTPAAASPAEEALRQWRKEAAVAGGPSRPTWS